MRTRILKLLCIRLPGAVGSWEAFLVHLQRPMGDMGNEEAITLLFKSNRLVFIGLLTIFLLSLFVLVAEAGQKEKISATKKYGPVISRNVIYPGSYWSRHGRLDTSS